MKKIATGIALGAMVVATVALTGGPGLAASGNDSNTQVARLYQLQAAIHGALSVHDPVNGDPVPVITQRIRDALSLWTDDGSITLSLNIPAIDGTYVGNGNPDDASTCPPLSTDPSARGTLCTLFKYVGGAFRPGAKIVTLAPAYLTHFDVHGDTASIHYQNHVFNVTLGADGQPLWMPLAHQVFDGTARKVDGRWLFANGVATVATKVPTP
ncbi:MAG TPA: hypothetical protein VGN09_25220 [Vicinamibacteria bacterium]|jgi:hypothetical protein